MMEMEGSPAQFPRTEADAAQAALEDLRLRLLASQEQERAARAAARRLARELAVTRRLLAFSYGGKAPGRAARRPPPAGPAPRVRALRLTSGAIFTLEACERRGEQMVVAGWAFHPASTWDALAATITILFRHGLESYAAATGRVFRPDVAAHFAAQPDEASGGARGLANVGFACEVSGDSLPGGVELDVVLRLECEGLVCEQPTGRRVRL